jgi:preprotein translocase subunit YajC
MHASPHWVILIAVIMAQQPAVFMQTELLWQDGTDVVVNDVPQTAPVDATAPAEGEVVVPNPAGDQPAVPEKNPFISFFENPINLILISAILFLFIVIRPQQKQLKEQQKLLAGLKKNDRVVTNSGIHGTVTQAAEGEAVVVLRIDDNSGAKLTINRDSIAKVVTAASKE